MKLFASLSFMILFGLSAVCQQKDTLSAEDTKAILAQLNLDTASFLNDAGVNACKCIDSISLSNKDRADISGEVSNCIDAQVAVYQSVLKMYRSLKYGPNKEILVNMDKNSKEYKLYYYEIERWLMDSCASLKTAVSSNNKESEFSISEDPKAKKEYDEGVDAMNEDDYKKALSHFKKAADIDPKFAFAWDNIGFCNRKLGNYDEALAAYNKSLAIDPKGHMPLQNIAVVYEFQKKYEKALEAYQNIEKYYPDDPEAHYGAGRIYTYFLVDLEKALYSLCKAYNIYVNTNSPYRVDAEKQINYVYGEMKTAGKEKRFFEILKENNISTGN